MELNDLKHFHAVASHGGFSKAARELRLQQPTLSRAVQRLEETLGVNLFQRNTRHVELTLEGQRLLHQCQSIFAAIQSTPSIVRAENQELQGYLQIAASDSLIAHVLPQVLQSYSERYPKVIVSVATGTEPHLLKRLEAGDLDCGIMFSQPDRRQKLTAEPILNVPFYFAIATKCRNSKAVLNSMIAAREVEDGRAEEDTWFEHYRKISPDIQIQFSSNSYALHKELVLKGLAISVFPRFAIEPELKGGLLTVLNKNMPMELALNLLRKKHHPLSPKALAFIEILRGAL